MGDKANSWQKFAGDTLGRLNKNASEYKGAFGASFTDTAVTLINRTTRLQRDAFFAAYIEEAGRKLGEPLGFPLAKSATRMMTVDQLKEAEKQLTLIAQDLSFPTMPKAQGTENPAWQNFTIRAGTLGRVSRAILGEELTPGECIVSLMKADESTKNQDEWQIGWRDIRLVANRGGSARTGALEDQKLGSPTMDSALTFQLVQSAADPNARTSPYAAGEWGAIALLHKFKNPQKLDATTWAVAWPLKATDGLGAIRLKLKFERALPELESWPEK